MNNETIRQLKQGTRIYDTMSGEESKFLSFPDDSAYVICDNFGTTIFLPPERIELIK